MIQNSEDRAEGEGKTLKFTYLQVLDSPATDLFLNLGIKWLVVEVKQLFAIKSFQSSQHTLAYSPYSNRPYNLTLKIVLAFRHSGNIPATTSDLLVRRDEIADKNQDGHDDVLGHRYNVGTCDLGDGDTAIRLVCSIQIDMIRSNTCCDREFEFLRFGETFRGQITRMKAARDLDQYLQSLKMTTTFPRSQPLIEIYGPGILTVW